MSRVFITGSADGLGQLSARQLVAEGHEVVLHARSPERGREALAGVPGAAGVLTADLAGLAEVWRLADEANAGGRFDAVIHNAGIGYRQPEPVVAEDGVERVFAVNVLAPYVLTARMQRPGRLIYLSSGMHRGGDPDGLSDLGWRRRRWSGSQAYSDSKLYDTTLAFAIARRWGDVYANAVEPGWVATKMGGPGAPDDFEAGGDTQAWLAVSDDPDALVSGRLLYHRRVKEAHPAASDVEVQDRLVEVCREVSGVELPD